MNNNNILGAVFLTIFPTAYLLSMISVGGLSDTYEDFCKKVDCPNPENIDFDPSEVYKKAQAFSLIFGFGLICSIWVFFYIKDRFFDKRITTSKDALGMMNGSES